ncbi:MAG: fatty acyl-AMP ligase [Dongiaceae bacterium]
MTEPKPTPTTRARLPYRCANFATLAEGLDYAAQGQCGFNFYSARGQLLSALPYAELRDRAIALARGLIAAGLNRGDRVLMIADTDPDFMIAFFACQYAGLLPASAAIPTSLGGREAYIASLRRLLQSTGSRAAMAPDSLIEYLREAADGLDLPLVGGPQDFYNLAPRDAALRTWQKDERCYLQFSSGSTRFPLGIDISQRVLMANAYAIATYGLEIGAEDRCTSWLPLYHDMGLVGFALVPMLTQMSVDYLATRDFARRPLMWPTLITMNGGTLSYSPSFGYDLAARRLHDGNLRVEGIDLSRWRGAGIGGDMIQPKVLERFADIFGPYGFRREAFVPSYGMAETALAISFAPLDTGVEIDRVDRQRLAERGEAVTAPADASNARDFVLCGKPLGGHRIEVRDETGRALPERKLGRVFVSGPSIMVGYFEEPEATAAVLQPDGWLDTGDLGYLTGGQIVITGRSKDLIIINGRNIWPQDLEWSVEDGLGLRRGDTAAFAFEGDDGSERVMMLVQCRVPDDERRQQLARDVAAILQRSHAVEAGVSLVPPHGLPQTSSGKLSRTRAKANWLSGLYQAGPDGMRKTASGAS